MGDFSEVLLVKIESCRKVYITIPFSKTLRHNKPTYAIGNTNICKDYVNREINMTQYTRSAKTVYTHDSQSPFVISMY